MLNSDFKFRTFLQRKKKICAQQVPRSLPISSASQEKLLQYPFSWEGFAEPHIYALLSFRALLSDMQHSWFYFLSSKWFFFVWTDATECFVQPHKTLSLPWAVCVRHHRLIQAKKWVCDQFSCAVSNSQSKFQDMENCIIFRLQVYSFASHNRENIGPLVEWQITSIEVIIYVFPDRHCSLATGTDTLHTFG